MTRSPRKSGQALIEVTLLIPWMVLAFVAAFNFGIFAYALVSTQNAARSAAMYASQSLTVAQSGSIVAQVCPYALGELGDAPGVGTGVTTCTLTAPAVCAGVLAVIFVLDTTTTLVAALAPNLTDDAPVKFVPVIVTA